MTQQAKPKTRRAPQCDCMNHRRHVPHEGRGWIAKDSLTPKLSLSLEEGEHHEWSIPSSLQFVFTVYSPHKTSTKKTEKKRK